MKKKKKEGLLTFFVFFVCSTGCGQGGRSVDSERGRDGSEAG